VPRVTGAYYRERRWRRLAIRYLASNGALYGLAGHS
jgi:hypothetical protein